MCAILAHPLVLIAPHGILTVFVGSYWFYLRFLQKRPKSRDSLSGEERLIEKPVSSPLRAILSWVGIIASLLAMFKASALAFQASSTGLSRESPPVAYVDALSASFALGITVASFAVAVAAHGYLRGRFGDTTWERTPPAYHTLVSLLVMSALCVVITDNLLLLWVFSMLTTMAATALVGFEHGDKASMAAAWNHLLMNVTGAAFALLGTMLLARGFQGKTTAVALDVSTILARDASENVQMDFMRVAFLFALIGYGTRVGLAPMHTWLPDSHTRAPYPASALLSAVLVPSSLFALLRFYSIFCHAVPGRSRWAATIVLLAGVFSVLVAQPFLLKPNARRRVLAYQTLEQMGLVAVGVGLDTRFGIFAALLHMLYHTIAKTLVILSEGSFEALAGQDKELNEARFKRDGLASLGRRRAFVLGFGVMGLAGLPGGAIFVSKLMIFAAVVQRAQERGQSHLWWVFAVLVLTSLTSLGSLMHHLVTWLLGHDLGEPTNEDLDQTGLERARRAADESVQPVPDVWSIRWSGAAPPIVLLAALILLGFILPRPLQALIEAAALAVKKVL